jgi:hypothetical protein
LARTSVTPQPVGYYASGRHVPFRFPAIPPRESANPSAWRWEEVGQARHASWHEVANWIKTAALFGGLSLIVLMLDAAGDITSATLKGLSNVPATSASDGSGLWGTVDHPVRVFLADQAAHLAVAPAALYAFWQLTGLLGLVGGFFGNAGARIAWVLFGIGSLAMIWSTAPAGGRAAATGLAALMWALASSTASSRSVAALASTLLPHAGSAGAYVARPSACPTAVSAVRGATHACSAPASGAELKLQSKRSRRTARSAGAATDNPSGAAAAAEKSARSSGAAARTRPICVPAAMTHPRSPAPPAAGYGPARAR